MKFMIRSDLEGVTGVTTYNQAENSKFGKLMLENDLNSCIEGLLLTGDHEIVIYDEHTDGRNINIINLPSNVSVICGKPLYQKNWAGGLDSSFDAMIMIGFHARAGITNALLPHSYSHYNLNIYINNIIVGEIGMEVAIAGDFGVPLWLITGDSAGIKEANEFVQNISTVIVKEAIDEFTAKCFSPKLTSKMIYEAAVNIVRNHPKVSPRRFREPVELKIDLAKSNFTEVMKTFYKELFINSNTLCINAKSVVEAWSEYLYIEKKVSTILKDCKK